MILNEILTKQNVFTKILLQDGNKELNKALKVKIMRVRMAYSKIKKRFDEEVQEFTKELVPQELIDLNSKLDKTETEELRFKELNDKINSEYQEFLFQKGEEEVLDVIDDSLTEEEYFEIVDVNSGNNTEINGNKINAADFLEIIYDMFVK
jgi:hypothetical protein